MALHCSLLDKVSVRGVSQSMTVCEVSKIEVLLCVECQGHMHQSCSGLFLVCSVLFPKT